MAQNWRPVSLEKTKLTSGFFQPTPVSECSEAWKQLWRTHTFQMNLHRFLQKEKFRIVVIMYQIIFHICRYHINW